MTSPLVNEYNTNSSSIVVSKPHLVKKYLPDYSVKFSTPIGALGCYRYSFDQPLSLPASIWDEVVCTPLNFRVPDKKSICQLIEQLCRRVFKVVPSNILRDHDRFYPIYQMEYFHLAKDEWVIFEDFDHIKYDGYQTLNCDPLVWKALDRVKYVQPVEIDGFYLVPNDIDQYLDRDENRSLLDSLQGEIDSLTEKGYTAFSIDNKLNPVIEEIAEVWGMKVEHYHQVLLIQAPSIYGCSLHAWIKRSIEQCLENKLPIVHFSGNWLGVEYTHDNLGKLRSIVKLAYSDCIESNPYLEPFMNDLVVMSDLSVAIPVFDPDDWNCFLRSFYQYIEGMDSLPNQVNKRASTIPPLDDQLADLITDSTGVRIGNRYLIRLEQPTANNHQLQLLEQATKRLWLTGIFVSTWGNIYKLKTGRISKIYFRNTQVAATIDQALTIIRELQDLASTNLEIESCLCK